MNQQRKGLSRHNSRQSSMGETASVGSSKSNKSNGSADYFTTNTTTLSSINNQQSANKKQTLTPNGLTKRHGSQDSGDSGTGSQPSSILNVAEMLLHGVADNEILNIWLRSIQCEEFVSKFIDSGYDMPTISRITPQDLTAIGVTEPTKRLKILTEIKKLNLQDGIPNFKPTSLNHWLTLIRLDSYYYKSLCDQQIDTIGKLCQLTWEDFEELGITKLGHQKRFQLAIERMKELEAESKCSSKKPISEPIYDTNPSQILLVASSENHCMNGPIINKQSSTSELSSTGSGSMHSVYSAASTHYQPTYAPISDINQQTKMIVNQLPNANSIQQNHTQQQVIYGQISPQNTIYQQPSHLTANRPQQSHYQQQPPLAQSIQSQFGDVCTTPLPNASGNMMNSLSQPQQLQPQHNRQSMSQMPFNVLASLPKHQQQLLQKSSIYATLSRQPSKAKQPPPVPIRTNSLKSNSLIEEQANNHQQQPEHATSTNDLFKTGYRMTSNRNQFNSQTMLTKNKSFSGNAHMEASRARFLNRASQQPQQFNSNLSQQIQTMLTDRSSIVGGLVANSSSQQNSMNQNYNIYGERPTTNGIGPFNGASSVGERGQSNVQMSVNNYVNPSNSDLLQSSTMPRSLMSSINTNGPQHQQGSSSMYNRDDFDIHSDTNSTKSLIMPPSAALMVTSPVENSSLSQDSGSSQTLYNSASSGSNSNTDQQNSNSTMFSGNNFSQSGDLISSSGQAIANCNLYDANLILDRHQVCSTTNVPYYNLNSNGSSNSSPAKNSSLSSSAAMTDSQHCNATTGKDDHFPPPPSPLSLTDSDEHDLVSLNSDSNFTDVNRGMMTFRVGI